MTLEQKVARALLSIKAVGFVKGEPIRFKSGILSPVYVDNRKLPSFPKHWKIILKGKKDLIKKKRINFDIIAGIETAGIPHSAALGFYLNKPSVFVRKQAKEHGHKKRVEGGEIKNKKVLLIEDLVTMGGSSLSGVEALRTEGGKVQDCLVIVNYGFPESTKAFKKAKVRLHALAPFATILKEAIALGKCTLQEAQSVREWYKDPWAWTKKRETK
jgi:orotate phosphoribosyltransferase